MKIPSSILTMLVGIGVTLISLWYGQNHGLLPVAASDEAADIDGLFNTMMTISTGLFLIVQGALITAAIKYRRRPGDNTDGPPWHDNLPLEILWTSLPAIIILGIGVYSFEIYNAMGGLDPMGSHDRGTMQSHANMKGSAIAAALSDIPQNNSQKPPEKLLALGIGASPQNEEKAADLVVNVMGLQYAWIFTYPESGVTSGELHLPEGREVQLNISAQDVLHAFWLPEFRLKQDAIPGRPSELRFTPNKAGEYRIVCAELCGAYHGAMKGLAIVQSPEVFNSWLQEQQVASTQNLEETVAVNPDKLSDGEFLAPYTRDLGVNSKNLNQLHPTHQSK
ncbi:MAG: cytochrome c oxidase subunit II [Oscillatoriales cyanobacterium RU_3_3]|nr:cytochrome c oxidase subunit II [Microcoleus sp. SU_5_6]NJL68236.1 cytochrome c oxidase subunit II [Microcoleus sp. SM1_3_4]NJM61399.1 cytochrome c oxidase subunit II [Oscillatoriales cyanobacterium RU_3_3]NJR23797.1 cytochrome c oxidase subunit II [Richelia sp. CSU_2_1]